VNFGDNKNGDVNFFCSQGEYNQRMAGMTFKTKWWKKPAHKVEINLSMIIVYSFIILVLKDIVMIAYRYIN